ncbi:MAG TPA: hypothetical protein VMU10_07595, partial [Desulfomonilia bacterium]|nr:hypothetical protein [Desulfomonilia bacterium]
MEYLGTVKAWIQPCRLVLTSLIFHYKPIQERLRLAMYLQLAGRNDEGWRALNDLSTKYIDVFSQVEIANQMRIDRENVKSSIKLADEIANLKAEFKSLTTLDIDLNKDSEVVGTTPKGNKITDKSYTMFKERIEDSICMRGILNRLT